MAISSGCFHCSLCEAVVEDRERRNVATTFKYAVLLDKDAAVFNHDSKLCRRCHRKLVASLRGSKATWHCV